MPIIEQRLKDPNLALRGSKSLLIIVLVHGFVDHTSAPGRYNNQ